MAKPSSESSIVAAVTDGPPEFAPGMPVPSPCVGICRMDADGRLCTGCGRTLDEIANWSRASDAAKRAVWRRLRGASTLPDG